MRRLCGKILLFLTGLGLLLFPLCTWSLHADKAALASSAFKMGPEITLVSAGDSHTQSALNPDLLPGAVNISRSAESYFFTYYKLKYFLQCNPQVTAVLLGYSPHNIMNHDLSFQRDRTNHLKDYIRIIDSPTRRSLAAFRLSYVVSYLQAEYGVPFRLFQNPIFVKYLLGRHKFSRADFPFNASYQGLSGTFIDPDKVARRGKGHFLENGRYAATSPFMVGYLKKIAELCSQRGIALVLVDTPVTSAYHGLIPAAALSDNRLILSELMREYPSVTYCDLSTLNLPSKDYYDGNHVNSSGAKVVSAIILKRYGSTVFKHKSIEEGAPSVIK